MFRYLLRRSRAYQGFANLAATHQRLVDVQFVLERRTQLEYSSRYLAEARGVLDRLFCKFHTATVSENQGGSVDWKELLQESQALFVKTEEEVQGFFQRAHIQDPDELRKLGFREAVVQEMTLMALKRDATCCT